MYTRPNTHHNINSYTTMRILFFISLFLSPLLTFARPSTTNSLPTFVNGTSQTVSFCENALATPINAQLAINDADTGQTETWTITTAPSHGTLTGFAATVISTGATLTPGGLTYTPAPGYSGTDIFTIQISDGLAVSTTTLNVTIFPIPNAGTITGVTNLCAGSSSTFTTTGIGGAWSSSNLLAARVGTSTGIVTGIAAGAAVISYSVTNSCGTVVATSPVTVGTGSLGAISGASSICELATSTLTNATSGGNWSSSNTSVATIGATDGLLTGIGAGTATIVYTAFISCGLASVSTVARISPLADAGTISGTSNICSGSFARFSSSVSGGLWSSSDALIANVGSSSAIVTGIAAGVATISYTVVNSCSSSTAFFPITIGASAAIGAITGGSAVCGGAHLTLSDTTSGGIWSTMNSGIATVGSATGIVSGVSAGTATIVYTVSAACGTATATNIVRVNALSSLISSHNPPATCSGSLFSYVPVASYPGATFTWSRPYTSGISNPSSAGSGDITETLVNSTYYDVSVTYTYIVSALGCTNTQYVTVVIHPTPRLSSALTATVCSGATFNYTPTAATPGTTYTWSRANVAGITPATATGTGNISEALVNGSTSSINVDYAFALSANGCTSLRDLVVTVTPQPSVTTITTQCPSSVCSGTQFQNFGAGQPLQYGQTYTWSAVNANIYALGAGQQYCLVSFPNSGNASVTLTVSVGGANCRVNSTVPVTVSSSNAVSAGVVYHNDQLIYMSNTPSFYQWGYDDVATLDSTIIEGALFQSLPIASLDLAHYYYWVMTSEDGCTQKTYYNKPLAISNVNQSSEFRVYPNPASNLLNVTLPYTSNSKVEIAIINIYGQVVRTSTATTDNTQFDINNLPSGCYIVNCTSDGEKIANTRFIKN